MLTRAWIQEEGNGKMSVEAHSLLTELSRRGVPVTLFTQKRLERRQLEIDRTTLVAGYVPTVLLALKQLGIEPPPTNDYPTCLHSLLHRRIWPSTVGRMRHADRLASEA